MDMRLKELTLTCGDVDYNLRCNFAVLADLDDVGGVNKVLKSGAFKSALVCLTAMLNDWARRNGEEERYTTADATAILEQYDGGYVEIASEINRFVIDALVDTSETSGASSPEEDDEKN